jgi:hypothetical protein
VPVILCDEWTEAQVKAFRLMVNRSVGWAEWDDEMLAQELVDLKGLDFDLSLTRRYPALSLVSPRLLHAAGQLQQRPSPIEL